MPVSVRVVSTAIGTAIRDTAYKGDISCMYATDNDRTIAKANLFIP